MSTAILVILTLVGVGIVIDQLFRLRTWLKKPPSSPEVREPPDGQP